MNQNERVRLIAVIHKNYKALLDKGATLIFEGTKHTGGQDTGVPCIKVCVHKKMAASDVSPSLLIPERIEGFVTDIEEARIVAGPPIIPSQQIIGVSDPTKRIRPVPMGVSIGHVDITAGTAAVLGKINGNRVVLTNAHVGAPHWQPGFAPGTLWHQPGPYDHQGGGGTDANWNVAKLEGYVPIQFKGSGGGGDDGGGGDTPPIPPLPPCPSANAFAMPYNALASIIRLATKSRFGKTVLQAARPRAADPENAVDVSWAAPTTSFLQEVANIGTPAGVAAFRVGDRVQKHGRTTGHTIGVVESVDGFADVDYGDGNVARFVRQIVVRGVSGDFSAGGDSGSSVWTMDMRWGGLLFAGGGGITLCNQSSEVAAATGVELVL